MINSLAAGVIWFTVASGPANQWQMIQAAAVCSSFLEAAQQLSLGQITVIRNSQLLMDIFLQSLPEPLQVIAVSLKQQLQESIAARLISDKLAMLDQIREVSTSCVENSSHPVGYYHR